jgi:hypothetical protein
MAALRAEIDSVERHMVRHLEPGWWAMVVAVAVFVLLVAELLPWVGSDNGWRVLLGQADPAGRAGVLPRLFAGSSLFFGVFASAITLATRRWGLAWLCALGCAFSVVHGLWAVWSRQTSGVEGPGVGLVLALLTMLVLAIQWLRLAWSRP